MVPRHEACPGDRLRLNNWAIKPEWQDPETGRSRRLKVYGKGHTFRTLVVRSIAKNISYQPVHDVPYTIYGTHQMVPDVREISADPEVAGSRCLP